MMIKQNALLYFIVAALLLSSLAACSSYTDVSQKISISRSMSFPQSYVTKNRGQVIIEIPEVYELLNVIVALSTLEEENTSLTNKEGPYYQDVLSAFAPYKDHPAVQQIKSANEQMGYSTVRQLFMYEFNENTISPGNIYNSEKVQSDLSEFAEQLADFAQKSDFRAFYQANHELYARQIAEFEQLVPVRQIWTWLEERFPIEHDTYKIILSPLVGGSHNTMNYVDQTNGYSEIVMFVSAPNILSERYYTPKVAEGLMSRMLFTEIDHNYVNPVTNYDENIRGVVRAFKDLSKWNSQGSYQKPALTFNEYMTWGVFMLYAGEFYDGDDLNQIHSATITIMNYRGFTQFEDFSNKLLELYTNRETGQTIDQLYPSILKWCEQYSGSLRR